MERFQYNTNTIVIAIIIVFTLIIVGVGALILPGARLSAGEVENVLTSRTDLMIGNPDAAVTIVEFGDFQCPGCSTVAVELKQVVDTYGHNVRLIFRNYPLVSIHQNAFVASEAGEAAAAQGKFWEFYDLIYLKQAEWSALPDADFKKKLKEYAQEIKVADIARFEKEVAQRTYKPKVDQDVADGEKVSVRQTPTVFINGELIANPVFSEIEAKIKEIVPGIQPSTPTPTPTKSQ